MIGAQVPPESKFHLAGSLFCLIGFFCGLIALFGIPKYGTKGILVPAIIGMSITGLLIFAVIGLIGRKERMALQQQHIVQQQRANAQAMQEGENAVLDYPGWLGKAQVSGGLIIAVSVDEVSQASQDYNSHFSKKYSLMNLSVNNASGTETLAVDPYSLKIVNMDGSTQSSANADEVVSSVSTDRQGFIAHYPRLITVAPGRQSTDIWGFFVSGTDYSRVATITVSVNGQEVALNGQFFTQEQKKELFNRGKQMQQ